MVFPASPHEYLYRDWPPVVAQYRLGVEVLFAHIASSAVHCATVHSVPPRPLSYWPFLEPSRPRQILLERAGTWSVLEADPPATSPPCGSLSCLLRPAPSRRNSSASWQIQRAPAFLENS